MGEGDRVAGYMPNMPETIIAMLAATSLGAVWSSASPDFGAPGLLDRIGQIEPKVLIAADGYYYGGKSIDCLEKVREVQPRVKGLQHTIIVPFVDKEPELKGLKDTVTASAFTAALTPEKLAFVRVAFDHPLFILFSSGTTGPPKCIVHGHGGTLLQHLKEHPAAMRSCAGRPDVLFHHLRLDDVELAGLGAGRAAPRCCSMTARPSIPTADILFDYADAEHDDPLRHLGQIHRRAAQGRPRADRDARSVCRCARCAPTGSPLAPESFDYVYDEHQGRRPPRLDLRRHGHRLLLRAGQPDICRSGAARSRGAGLGMAVDVFDENGKPIPAARQGRTGLHAGRFPAMPVGFWNDPDGKTIPRRLFRALSRHLVPRRLRRT